MKKSTIISIILIIAAGLIGYGLGTQKLVQKTIDVRSENGTPVAETKEPIKIGALLPLTGWASEFGNYEQKSLETTVKIINNSGGIIGKQIKLFVEDSQTDNKEGLNAYHKLSDLNNVNLFITDISGVALATAPFVNQKNQLLFSLSSHPDVTKEGSNMFRHWTTADYEGRESSRLAKNYLNLAKIGIIYLNDDFGTSNKDAFKKYFSGEIIHEEAYEGNSLDFKTQITKIMHNNPDAIYIRGYGNAHGLIIKQIRELNYQGVIFSGPEMLYADVLTSAGEAANGVIFVDFATNFDKNARISQFTSQFKQDWDKEPDITAAIMNDMLNMYKWAIEKSNSDNPVTLKDALLSLKNFEGIAGNLSISLKGDVVIDKLILKKIEAGKPIPIE